MGSGDRLPCGQTSKGHADHPMQVSPIRLHVRPITPCMPVPMQVNLKKSSVKVSPSPDQPGQFLVSFSFDATAPCRYGASAACIAEMGHGRNAGTIYISGRHGNGRWGMGGRAVLGVEGSHDKRAHARASLGTEWCLMCMRRDLTIMCM